MQSLEVGLSRAMASVGGTGESPSGPIRCYRTALAGSGWLFTQCSGPPVRESGHPTCTRTDKHFGVQAPVLDAQKALGQVWSLGSLSHFKPTGDLKNVAARRKDQKAVSGS